MASQIYKYVKSAKSSYCVRPSRRLPGVESAWSLFFSQNFGILDIIAFSFLLTTNDSHWIHEVDNTEKRMGDSVAHDGQDFVRPGCCLCRWDRYVLIFHLFLCVSSYISNREGRRKRRKKTAKQCVLGRRAGEEGNGKGEGKNIRHEVSPSY